MIMKKILIAMAFFFPALVFANWDYGVMSGWGMMDGWGMMGGGVFGGLSSLVWLVVGVLAAIWLWQHIDKK